MEISLEDRWTEFVREQVASGRYKDHNQVVQAALALLEEDARKWTELRRKIQEGIDSIEAGTTFSGEEAKAMVRAAYKNRRSSQ